LNHDFDVSPLVVKKMGVTELLCCARRLCLLFCRFIFSVLQKRHGKSILYMHSFHRSIFKNFVQSCSTESNSFVDSWAWQEILAAAAAETGKSQQQRLSCYQSRSFFLQDFYHWATDD
jgi:hypothetical protein